MSTSRRSTVYKPRYPQLNQSLTLTIFLSISLYFTYNVFNLNEVSIFYSLKMKSSSNPVQFLLIYVYPFVCFITTICSALNSDGLSLLALKSAIATDPTRVLDSWSEFDSTPCHWIGITCNRRGRVVQISLSNKGFTGYIPSELGSLSSLEKLVLSYNNFSHIVPIQLFNATSVVMFDVSHNFLSGVVSDSISELRMLTRLDLSSNCFNGSLPESLSELSNLAGTLNLSYNSFSGEVPASYGMFPVLVSLDLRHNNLTGKIPQVGSLLNQGPTAFSGNPGLCGFPLKNSCPEAKDPSTIDNRSENPIDPNNLKKPNGSDLGGGDVDKGEKERESVAMAIPLISGISVLVGAVSVTVWIFRKKKMLGGGEGKMEKEKELSVVQVDEEDQKGKFVLIDERFNLGLEDLLRASAYVVGKSKGGIVYKVVVSGGGAESVVAVRRLSENDATWRFKEFDAEVDAIGRVQHPNIVPLRAYYYANDEKLLVSDYISNGSLYTALHGGPANTSPSLSWAARLNIVKGIARGLVHIHEHAPRKYIHGNLKSSKVLLDHDLQPYISGFGLTRLISRSTKSTSPALKKQNSNKTVLTTSVMGSKISVTSVSYTAPEARGYGGGSTKSKLSQKCDVYSFGIVLMEILTGKFPDPAMENDNKGLENMVRKVFREERPLSEIIDPCLLQEVHSKKQVVVAFHIALNCTELDAELRPRMRMVLENLERIKLQ